MRKYLILLSLALLCTVEANAQCSNTSYGGGWVCVQGVAFFQNSSFGVASVTTGIITPGVTNGDLIIVGSEACASITCTVNTPQTITISDNASNSYTVAVSNSAVSFGGNFVGATTAYVCNSVGVPTQFTATNSDTVNGSFMRIVVTIWHNTNGAISSTCLDKKSTATYTTGSGTSAAIATTSPTTGNNDLIYSDLNGQASPGPTATGGFVLAQQDTSTGWTAGAKNGVTPGSYPTGWTFSSAAWFGDELAFFNPSPANTVARTEIPIRQSCSASTNAASINCVFNQNTVTGDAIIIGISYFGTSNTASASDTLSTTYTRVLSDVSHTEKVAVLTGVVGSSGANTINVAVTSGQFMNVNVVELIGTAPCDVSQVDTSSTSTFSGTPSTVTIPDITTTLNSDCIYQGAGNDNSAGWQSLQDANLGTWWQVGSMGGTDSGSGFFTIGGEAGAGNNLTVDNGGTSGTMFNIAFKSNALAIQSPAAAPDGGTTTAYNYTEVATGGAGAYTWSISAGSLPTGLSIDSSTGAITGTPTVSNNYTATIQVQDAGAAHTATKVTTFKITTGLNTITFVQGAATSSSASSTSVAFGSNVTAGNLLLVDVGFGSHNTNAEYCTDSIGTQFKRLTLITDRFVDVSNFSSSSVFAGIAPSSAADTVTCTQVQAVSELANANFVSGDNVDYTRGSTASPATVTSNSLITLVPNQLIFADCTGFTSTGTMAVQAPFTQIGATSFIFQSGYRIVTTATGYTESCAMSNNTSNVWRFSLVGIRPSGGTVVPPVVAVPRKHGTFIGFHPRRLPWISTRKLRITTI